MNVLQRLFRRRSPPSREIAKERLKLILVYDRVKISPDLLQTLKDEIISVISEYIEIDREATEVTLQPGKKYSRLVANIPIIGTRRRDE